MAGPFHRGERMLQQRAGMGDRIEEIGHRVFRDFMPDQHRELFEKLPYVLVGSLDAVGRPWASVLFGRPGFLSSPDARTLRIAACPVAGDPLAQNLAAGAPIGLLGIELDTRRRNRMNGTVIEAGGDGFAVKVEQSFGNCPKYIQARAPAAAAGPAAPRLMRAEKAILSAESAALVRRTDTFFIATAAAQGVDVSHRGGKPGFVRVEERGGATLLTAPDFRGNFFFNTFGNLALDPGAGMLFIDFESGDALSLTGEAEVIWDGAELEAFAGAERLLRFRAIEGLVLAGAVPQHWSAAQPAPQLQATGSWEKPAQSAAAC